MMQRILRAWVPALMMAAALAAPARAQENKAAKTVTLGELTRLIGGPTLVSLHFKNAMREAVFDEMARQAKVGIDARFIDTRDGKPLAPVSVDMERRPFWSALRALCTQFDLDVSTGSEENSLGESSVLIVGPRGAGGLAHSPVSDHGLVLVVAGSSSRFNDLEYLSPGRSKVSRELRLFLLVDPKLRLLDGIPALHSDAVVDEKGRVICKPRNPGQSSGGKFGLWTDVIYFSNGGPADSRLAEVKGTARLFVGFNVERWSVPDILQARNVARTVPRPAGASRYVVRDVVATDHDYEVRLAISQREFDLQNVLPLYSELEKRLHLLDARGREYSSGDVRVEDDSGDPVLLTVPFTRDPPGSENSPGRPQSLVIEIPDIRAVKVPFGFTDLPLP